GARARYLERRASRRRRARAPAPTVFRGDAWWRGTATRATATQALAMATRRQLAPQKDALDRAAIARRLGGVWKDRTDLGNTRRFVRRLRKHSRRRRLRLG